MLKRKAWQPKRFTRLEKTLLAVPVAKLKRTTIGFRAQIVRDESRQHHDAETNSKGNEFLFILVLAPLYDNIRFQTAFDCQIMLALLSIEAIRQLIAHRKFVIARGKPFNVEQSRVGLRRVAIFQREFDSRRI